MANECIPPLASAILELIKPPYDYSSSPTYVKRTPCQLTQPQIPIRFGSTYSFKAQALHEESEGCSNLRWTSIR